MDEKIESLIERGVSLLIGIILLLVGLIANVSDKAETILLAIAIPLITLATGIQLINSLPHAIVNAKNYVKNSGQPPTPPKILVDNSTELPEWLKGYEEEYKSLEERLVKLDKQQMETIEKEADKEVAKLESPQKAAEIESEQIRPDIEAPEPSLADVVFPEKEEPEIELKDHPADSELDEDVQETPKEE